MRYLIFLLVAMAGLFNPGAARTQDSPLLQLDTWGLSRGWEGVGLLRIGTRRTCTGVMIRPDLVLTAAHCLFDIETGERTDPRQVEFRAGWRNGKAIARRVGKAAIIHPDYVNSPEAAGDQVKNDLALLQLSSPIQATHANPFSVGRGVRTGSQVSVVSYGAGRNDAPSRQRECEVLQAAGGLIAMSCSVVPGSSGSPVFAMRNGRPRIVSLVSSLGELNGRQVSYGMDIERPFARLLDDFNAGRGVYPMVTFKARRIGVGQGRIVGGARFIRP